MASDPLQDLAALTDMGWTCKVQRDAGFYVVTLECDRGDHRYTVVSQEKDQFEIAVRSAIRGAESTMSAEPR